MLNIFGGGEILIGSCCAFFFSISPAVVKVVLGSFLVSFIQSQTAFSGGGGLLGPGSKQEHSWDMFKIGQPALHSKVDIYSSVDF